MPENTLKLSGKSGNFIFPNLWEPCNHWGGCWLSRKICGKFDSGIYLYTCFHFSSAHPCL